MRQRMDYPLVYDAADDYQRAYGLTSIPLNLLVDSAGVVRFKGAVLPADIGERIAALIDRSGSGEKRRE